MVEYVKIDEDTVEERSRIDLKIIRANIKDIDAQIDIVKTWPDKVDNLEKQNQLDNLKNMKAEWKSRLETWEKIK